MNRGHECIGPLHVDLVAYHLENYEALRLRHVPCKMTVVVPLGLFNVLHHAREQLPRGVHDFACHRARKNRPLTGVFNLLILAQVHRILFATSTVRPRVYGTCGKQNA